MSKYDALCTICDSPVSATSKHCGYCNRCVDKFDHHCKWLNNCIGEYNYKLFLACIYSLEACSIISFSICTYVGVGILVQDDSVNTEFIEFISREIIAALILIVSGANLAISIANGNLIGLHIWLKYKGMTTYEYILSIRNSSKKSTRVHILQENVPEDNPDLDMHHFLTQNLKENTEYALCTSSARKTAVLNVDTAEAKSQEFNDENNSKPTKNNKNTETPSKSNIL